MGILAEMSKDLLGKAIGGGSSQNPLGASVRMKTLILIKGFERRRKILDWGWSSNIRG
jgi:hypothetical protein